ncbi:MAG: zinc metallopeptidase [Planctomycetota bacterium]
MEFNAFSLALAVLDSGGILVGQEPDGARNVRNGAALTYVAAAVSAILQMGFYLLMLIGAGGDD